MNKEQHHCKYCNYVTKSDTAIRMHIKSKKHKKTQEETLKAVKRWFVDNKEEGVDVVVQ